MPQTSPRLVFAGYRFAGATLRVLPRSLALGIAQGAAWCWWRTSPSRRAVVAANLSRATGLDSDAPELGPIVRAAFGSYGRYWVDSTKIDPHDRHFVERRFRLAGGVHLEAALERGRGVILALPHLGSWEIGGVYCRSIGHPLTAVAEPVEPPELFEWFLAQRRRIGLEVIPAGAGAPARLLQLLERGGVLALVADRDVTGEGIEAMLFGEPTRLPGGPALLALRSGATLLPCAVYQRPGGVSEGVIRPPLDTHRQGRLRADVERVTEALVHEFESLIAAAPEQWHVFQPNWPSDAATKPPY